MKEINIKFCPICGAHYKIESYCPQGGFGSNYKVVCSVELEHSFIIMDALARRSDEEVTKALNIIAGKMLVHPYYEDAVAGKLLWHFDWDEANESSSDHAVINMARYMSTYPNNFAEKTNSIMLNISIKYPKLHNEIGLEEINNRLFYVESTDIDEQRKELGATLDILTQMGYLTLNNITGKYQIAAQGWIQIQEISEMKTESRQGFIAMTLSKDTEPVLKAIKLAIGQAKSKDYYSPFAINQKQHNNQIVPEILYEIKKSKFIVVEISTHCLGAYYEAGYAAALGKQVIICCKEDELEKVHFDIKQVNLVLWNNIEELIENLKNRIEASIE
jgi:hypothetical protein